MNNMIKQVVSFAAYRSFIFQSSVIADVWEGFLNCGSSFSSEETEFTDHEEHLHGLIGTASRTIRNGITAILEQCHALENDT